MKDIDAKVVGQIYRRCNAMMEFKAIRSDKRSRYNRAHLLGKETQRVAQKFNFTEGEMVSYGGRKVSLNSLEPAGSTNPTTCWVTDKLESHCMFVWTHFGLYQLMSLRNSCLKAMIGTALESLSFLTPLMVCLGASSPSLLLTINLPKSMIGCLCSTKLESSVWAPVWTNHDNEIPARYLKCPTDLYQPHIIAVDSSDIICGTDLQARKLTTAAVAMLENLGYEQFSAP